MSNSTTIPVYCMPGMAANSLIFQYKYRIQAHQKVAAAEGVHGKSIAIDTVFNSLVNDKGCRNTNKAGDLKVREAAVNCTKLRHSPSQHPDPLEWLNPIFS